MGPMHAQNYANHLFNRLDRDNSGRINLFRPFTNPRTAEFLRMADFNRDNHVDRFEMHAAVHHFIDLNRDRQIGPAERNWAHIRFGF